MESATKQLAQKLGLVRKRSSKKLQVKASGQHFSHFVVLDFESTCWEDKKFRTNEIIEFPAVLMSSETGEVVSEFHHYIMPQENPVLSAFCTRLTGISQEQVEGGMPLSPCLARFNRWLDQCSSQYGISFCGDGKTGNQATFITWSDWDLGVCLLNECRRKQLRFPAPLRSWIDLRATYRNFYSRRPQGLEGALHDCGIQFSGRQHSGVDDARNTARLAWRMVRDGCCLQVTKTLPPEVTGGKPSIRPATQARSKSRFSSVTPIARNLNVTSRTPWTIAQSVTVSSNSREDSCNVTPQVIRQTEASKVTPESYRPLDDSGYGSEKRSLNSGQKPEGFGGCFKKPDAISVGLRPQAKSRHSTGNLVSLRSTTGVNRSASASKFEGGAKRKAVSSFAHKITAPLCQCGRRASRKMVQMPGPNFGRSFFACPLGQRFNKNAGCGLFLWEDVYTNTRKQEVKGNGRIVFGLRQVCDDSDQCGELVADDGGSGKFGSDDGSFIEAKGGDFCNGEDEIIPYSQRLFVADTSDFSLSDCDGLDDKENVHSHMGNADSERTMPVVKGTERECTGSKVGVSADRSDILSDDAKAVEMENSHCSTVLKQSEAPSDNVQLVKGTTAVTKDSTSCVEIPEVTLHERVTGVVKQVSEVSFVPTKMPIVHVGAQNVVSGLNQGESSARKRMGFGLVGCLSNAVGRDGSEGVTIKKRKTLGVRIGKWRI